MEGIVKMLRYRIRGMTKGEFKALNEQMRNACEFVRTLEPHIIGLIKENPKYGGKYPSHTAIKNFAELREIADGFKLPNEFYTAACQFIDTRIKAWKTYNKNHAKTPREFGFISATRRYIPIYFGNNRIKDWTMKLPGKRGCPKISIKMPMIESHPSYRGEGSGGEDKSRCFIKGMMLVSRANGQYFELQIRFADFNNTATTEIPQKEITTAMGIDLGVNNFATVAISSDGSSYICDGRRFKAYNHHYNKTVARARRILSKQKLRWSKRLSRLNEKRKEFFRNSLRFFSNAIIDIAIQKHIDIIVIGLNKGWKEGIQMSKANKQTFMYMPHSQFINILREKAYDAGIQLVIQEESYSSKASFFDDDDIPVYNKGKNAKYTFSGERIMRGLYRTASGYEFNADVNGALNIMRKCKLVPRETYSGIQHIGHIPWPCRIRV